MGQFQQLLSQRGWAGYQVGSARDPGVARTLAPGGRAEPTHRLFSSSHACFSHFPKHVLTGGAGTQARPVTAFRRVLCRGDRWTGGGPSQTDFRQGWRREGRESPSWESIPRKPSSGGKVTGAEAKCQRKREKRPWVNPYIKAAWLSHSLSKQVLRGLLVDKAGRCSERRRHKRRRREGGCGCRSSLLSAQDSRGRPRS